VSVVLVSGGASGIGAAVAHRLHADGHQVVVADVQTTQPGPDGSDVLRCNVTDEADCQAAVDSAVARHGRLDGLVACAGIERFGRGDVLSAADFRAVVDVNLTGSFLLASAAGRQMLAQGQGGSVVLFGSINSTVAGAGQAAYCASKGAVLMLGKSLAVDWAADGITVNVIAPGLVETPLTAASRSNPERWASLVSRIPAGRAAVPGEIAGAVAFLLSPDARYVTGSQLTVDGGWLAHA
jgi:NAD(P)-dependent dehydrogenase (short-subunit alcohol dehydrogenase family)